MFSKFSGQFGEIKQLERPPWDSTFQFGQQWRMKVAKTRKKKVREAVNENLRGSQHYAQQLREAANAE